MAGTTAIPRSNYEAAQRRKGSLNQTRAVKPGSECSRPDCTGVNSCAGGEQSAAPVPWNRTNRSPSREGTEAAPWTQTLFLMTCFRWKQQNRVYLKLLVIIGTDEFSEQAHSWNFPQLFCFQPVLHQVWMPRLKTKMWNVSSLRFSSSSSTSQSSDMEELTHLLLFVKVGGAGRGVNKNVNI